MSEREGVTKFDLEYRPSAALSRATIAELDGWRTILHRLGLIGLDPARYGGVGYGNVSMRLPPFEAPRGARRFAISGTQTGGRAVLEPGHYAVVTAYAPAGNRVVAEGPIAPSSESLTHAMLYDLDPRLRFVFHAHAPEIWRSAARLGLPISDPAAPYGTPAMAEAVRALHARGALPVPGLFAMGGHEDGVVAIAERAEEAGLVLIRALARALTGEARAGEVV
ncbi:aldolase [Sulfurifustis variabilis]|uniref:Aldolase n=1 Tax=Sulfurifustis variabilis TaxID=1675686 RepID=A0A1B4V082_9GAMM|nr:class II aldolase/adducin family protein [Sulfurifustis variabilis]BAU46850.1 aldolase [Sulfurifustis variabilis]